MREQVQPVGDPIRAMVMAFTYRIPERVRNYVVNLLAEGVEVDLVIVAVESWSDHDLAQWNEVRSHPRLRVHTLDGAELRHPVRRAERLLVYRLPGGALARTRRLTRRIRPLDVPMQALENGHKRVADAFHHRVFMRLYRLGRPWLLSRLFRKRLRTMDFAALDRVVAADIFAVTLAWHLTRRHPRLVVTATLDLQLAEKHAAVG